MKKILSIAAALLVAFVASPASAEDGQVSATTLKALGLGNMQVASDADGMQVRGKASIAVSGGVSFAAGLAVTPFAATASGAANFGFGAAAHLLPLSSTAAQQNGSFANGAVSTTIPLLGTFSGAYSSNSGGFSASFAQ